MTEPAPRVQCRVIGGAQGRGLVAVWMFAMLAMSVGMALGAPAPLAALLLVAAIALGLRRLAGTATYTLETDGIRREWAPFAGGGATDDRRAFAELRSWKLDHTRARDFTRYEFIELDADRGPRWLITSRQDAEGFAGFRDAFSAHIAALDADGRAPRRRRSFYETWWGKVTSVALAAAVGGLVIAAALGLVALTGILKLTIFLVPGAAYLLWRSFTRR